MGKNITGYTTQGAVEYIVKDDWQEVKEPTIFTFDKIGDSLEATLLDLANETIEGRPVLTARMGLKSGEQVKIRPTFDLRQKIGRRLLGRRMLIVFDSENDATEGKGNKMKVFKLFVAPEASKVEPNPHGVAITDDDLPDF